MAKKLDKDELEDKNVETKALDEEDIALLKTYGLGPYATSIKKAEEDIAKMAKRVNEICGIKESDTGLAPPSQWDLVADKLRLQEEQPFQVARCTKIINAGTEDAKHVINVKQIAKFVVGLGERVAPTDIEEGMRVGVDRQKYQIQIPLPPKIDPTVTMMTVEEKPDITYNDVGGCKEQIEKLREVVETPLLHPERFVSLGIDPPKGVLLYGPPGTGKTLCARAVANRTDACFIRVIGSELVQKCVLFCSTSWYLYLNSLPLGMLVKVLVWLESSFRWQEQKRPASFSSTRLTRLVVLVLMMVQALTMKFRELCSS
eukprot:TRINITY_DN2605_c0_g1_i1.p1 TRINITY_DN2605_c0_g1~~TRINITY_DN2605_c0_g1_i1.p1  ORF type:complete len:328 (-),score=52.73 TRINITY_DN2605_c0_g1_i1:367-1314(-)